ncbi:MAG: hypothetical protein ACR2MK_04005 [Solirubrobacteraceae bacterium]
MATLEQKIDAEFQIRELLRGAGQPQPDRVEYGCACIRLFFFETKSVVVVDIDQPPDGLGDGRPSERNGANAGGGEP